MPPQIQIIPFPFPTSWISLVLFFLLSVFILSLQEERKDGGLNGPPTPFSSVQFSRSVVSDSLRPHELQHARPPCPSPTPRVHSNSPPSSWSCHPAILSSVVPFSSCPQSLPASESFPIRSSLKSSLCCTARSSVKLSSCRSSLKWRYCTAVYSIQHNTVKYTKAQPLVDMWQCMPGMWTNLGDWTCKCMLASLKVCNLKLLM